MPDPHRRGNPRFPRLLVPLLAAVLALANAGGSAATDEALAGQLEGAPLAKTYTLDRAHTEIGFQIRHLVSRVNGRFTEFDGVIVYYPEAPERSSVELAVQAASINTDEPRRDDHLRSSDFFEVETYPTISFRSTRVEPDGADRLQVTGDFTIKGVTRQIVVPVEIVGFMPTARGEKAGFETTFSIDRKDYGVTWNRLLDHGGAVLGDDVRITLQVAADLRPEG